jgi:hypothetical protein
MEREKLIEALLQNFIKTLFETLKPFQTIEENVDYLETLIEYLTGVYSHEPAAPEFNYEGNPFDALTFIRKNILLKYKNKAKPFVDTKLRYYFEKDEGKKADLFAQLNLTEPILTEQEYEDYINRIHHILNRLIEKICILPPESAKTDIENDLKALPESVNPNKGKFKSDSKEYTRKRQILLYYFVLKLIGINKGNAFMTEMAKFAHALLAWPTDDASNGRVYDLVKEVTNVKQKSRDYPMDLEFVKKQFEIIKHAEGIALVQKEIDGLKRQ